MAPTDLLVLTSRRVVLPEADDLAPATIEVDLATGKIAAVHQGLKSRDEYPLLPDERWVDAGDKCILPGLVESVLPLYIIRFN